ncbi:response regulator, partial [Salmonella enterica]|uniref:response regulator n=1 Tax=Salmonella enterica TaxID=28901 RepID=UPI0020A3B594
EDELLQALHQGSVDLLILELDLKHKDGITITSDIRNRRDIEQPFIVIFSAKQDDYIQITAFNAGADDFLTTPIKPILLEARICTLKKR